MVKNLICINCPIGCELQTEVKEDKLLSVKGNQCNRGVKYAQEELFHPMRLLTTSVYIPQRNTMLPVRSDKPIPKDALLEAVSVIKKLQVQPPVKMGQVLIENLEGAAIIASCDLW